MGYLIGTDDWNGGIAIRPNEVAPVLDIHLMSLSPLRSSLPQG